MIELVSTINIGPLVKSTTYLHMLHSQNYTKVRALANAFARSLLNERMHRNFQSKKAQCYLQTNLLVNKGDWYDRGCT